MIRLGPKQRLGTGQRRGQLLRRHRPARAKPQQLQPTVRQIEQRRVIFVKAAVGQRLAVTGLGQLLACPTQQRRAPQQPKQHVPRRPASYRRCIVGQALRINQQRGQQGAI